MKILETVDNSPCSKTLTIEVSPEEIHEEVDSLYKELSTQAEIPGFRPGRAPLHLLKMRFGRKVDQEARGKAAEKACQNALKELKLQIIGEPKVDLDDEEKSDLEKSVDPNEPLKFTFEFEYIPEFDVTDYKGLKIEIPRVEVTEERVDQVIESYRQQCAFLVPVPEDKKIEPGDILTIDVNAHCEGEPFPEATHDGYQLEIGSKQHLPGFEEALMGLGIGEEKKIESTLPEDYSIEKYRGKPVEFDVRVKQINIRKLPDVDDEFAKDLGLDSMEAFRKTIRDDLERQAENQRKDLMLVKIRNSLSETHPIAVPEIMVQAEFNYINALQKMELARMGTSFDALGEHKDKLLSRNREQAELRVRSSLIMEKIAEKEEIRMSETDYFEYLEDLSKREGVAPDQFVSRIHRSKLDDYYQRLALEQKILDFLLEQAEIKEVEPSEGSESEDRIQEGESSES